MPGLVLANPSGGVVVGGDVGFVTPDANTLLINQSTHSAAINWQSFSIQSSEYVIFNQPSASAVVLNRVVGGNPSEILGNLQANGRVFLINPLGVMFGEGAQVDVGGIVASTLDLSPDDFMAGRYVLRGDSRAGIANAGNITASDGGFVVLLGDHVSNTGAIHANLGSVVLASGSQVTLDFTGDGLIQHSIDTAAISDRAGVEHLGSIMADGGHVVMDANVTRDLKASVINTQGLVQARRIVKDGRGGIYLAGRGGDIALGGTLDSSGVANDAQGGRVIVTTDGDITMPSGSTIRAKGGSADRGGEVRVVAQGKYEFANGALIDATGGTRGGFVELSGHEHLTIRGDVNIGRGGSLLIDPRDVTIAQGAGDNESVPDGLYTDVTVYEQFVENQLRNYANVIIVADRSITLADLNANLGDGVLYGINASGTGGSLTLGIGTVSMSAVDTDPTGYGAAYLGDPSVVFTPGDGYSGYGILFEDLSNAIRTYGGINIVGGDTYGYVDVGNLETYGIAAHINIEAATYVSAGTIDSAGNVNIDSENGFVTVGNVSAYGASAIRAGTDLTAGNLDVHYSGSYENGLNLKSGLTGLGDLSVGAITIGTADVKFLQDCGDGCAPILQASSFQGDITLNGGVRIYGSGGDSNDNYFKAYGEINYGVGGPFDINFSYDADRGSLIFTTGAYDDGSALENPGFTLFEHGDYSLYAGSITADGINFNVGGYVDLTGRDLDASSLRSTKSDLKIKARDVTVSSGINGPFDNSYELWIAATGDVSLSDDIYASTIIVSGSNVSFYDDSGDLTFNGAAGNFIHADNALSFYATDTASGNIALVTGTLEAADLTFDAYGSVNLQLDTGTLAGDNLSVSASYIDRLSINAQDLTFADSINLLARTGDVDFDDGMGRSFTTMSTGSLVSFRSELGAVHLGPGDGSNNPITANGGTVSAYGFDAVIIGGTDITADNVNLTAGSSAANLIIDDSSLQGDILTAYAGNGVQITNSTFNFTDPSTITSTTDNVVISNNSELNLATTDISAFGYVDVSASSGNLAVGDVEAGGYINLVSALQLVAGYLDAGEFININAPRISVDGAEAGRYVNIVGSGGNNLTVGDVSGYGFVRVNSTGINAAYGVSVGNVTLGNGVGGDGEYGVEISGDNSVGVNGVTVGSAASRYQHDSGYSNDVSITSGFGNVTLGSGGIRVHDYSAGIYNTGVNVIAYGDIANVSNTNAGAIEVSYGSGASEQYGSVVLFAGGFGNTLAQNISAGDITGQTVALSFNGSGGNVGLYGVGGGDINAYSLNLNNNVTNFYADDVTIRTAVTSGTDFIQVGSNFTVTGALTSNHGVYVTTIDGDISIGSISTPDKAVLLQARDATNNGADIAVGNVTVGNAVVSILAADDVALNGAISTVNASVYIEADYGAGDTTMDALGRINTTSSAYTITAGDSLFLDAAEGINAYVIGSASSTVDFNNSATGDVKLGLNNVGYVYGTDAGPGNISITATNGNLAVGTSGITGGAGTISITTSDGNLTTYGAVNSSNGAITLDSNDAVAGTKVLTIGGNVVAGTGIVTLRSDDDIIINANVTGGSVLVTADNDDADGVNADAIGSISGAGYILSTDVDLFAASGITARLSTANSDAAFTNKNSGGVDITQYGSGFAVSYGNNLAAGGGITISSVAASGSLSVTGALTSNNGNVTVNVAGDDTNTNNLTVGPGGISTGTGALTLRSIDDVNIGGAISTTGFTEISADYAGTDAAGVITHTAGAVSITNIALNGLYNYFGGTLTVSTGTANFNKGLNWVTTSDISGGGTVVLYETSTVTGGARALNNIVLDNYGTLNLALTGASSLNLTGTAVLNNTAAGVVAFTATADGDDNLGGNGGTFNNQGGVIRNSSVSGRGIVNTNRLTGTGGTFDSSVGGILQLSPVATSGNIFTGNYTVNGSNVVVGGGTLRFNGPNVITGSLRQNSGTVIFTDLTLSGAFNRLAGTTHFGTASIGGLLTLNGAAVITHLTGGTLTANGGVNWNNDNAIQGPGSLLIPFGTTFNIAGAGNRTLSLGAVLNNAGTIDIGITTANAVTLASSATLNNLSTGVINFTATNSGADALGNGSGNIHNLGGTIRNSSSSGVATVSALSFTSTGGTFEAVGSSTLNLQTLTAAGNNFSGNYTIIGNNVFFGSTGVGTGSSGAAGTFNFNDAATIITGNFKQNSTTWGLVKFVSGASITGSYNRISGDTNFGAASIGGLLTLNGTGLTTLTGGTLTANGGVTWNNTGVISGSGTLEIPSTQIFNLNGTGDRTLNGATLLNNGTLNFNLTGGARTLFLNNGAVLTNNGLVDFTVTGGGDDNIATSAGSGNTLNNNANGIVRNTGGGNVTVTASQISSAAGSLFEAALGGITLNANGGALNLAGDIVAGAFVDLDSVGAVSLGPINSGGSLDVTANGIINNTSGALNIAGTTTVSAGSGNNIGLDFSTNNFIGAVNVISGQNFSIRDVDDLDLGNISISQGMTARATGALTDSGNLSIDLNADLYGSSITLGDAMGEITNFGAIGGDSYGVRLYSSGAVNLTEDGTLRVLLQGMTPSSLTLTSQTGDIAVPSLSSNGSLMLDAELGHVSLNGDLRTYGGGVTVRAYGDVTGATFDILALSADGLTYGDITVDAGLVPSATGGSVTLDGLTGNNVAIAAKAGMPSLGDITVGDIYTAGNMSFNASGDILAEHLDAGGAVILQANADINVSDGLGGGYIHANTLSFGTGVNNFFSDGDIVLAAAAAFSESVLGDFDLSGTLQSGGSIDLSAGGYLALANVVGGSPVQGNVVLTGDDGVTISEALEAEGYVDISSTGGDISTQGITAGGYIDLTADTGSVMTGDLGGYDHVFVTAGSAINVGAVQVYTAMSPTAETYGAQIEAVNGDVTVGAITVGAADREFVSNDDTSISVQSSYGNINLNGNVRLYGGISGGTNPDVGLGAYGDITGTGYSVQAFYGSSYGDLQILAGHGFGMSSDIGGDVTLANLTGYDVTVAAYAGAMSNGDITVGDIYAAGDLTLNADGTLTTTGQTTPGDLVITADALSFTGDVSANQIDISITGDNSNFSFNNLATTGGYVSVDTADGFISGGDITAAQGVTLMAGDNDADGDSGITVGAVTANGAYGIALSGYGNISADRLIALGDGVSIDANGYDVDVTYGGAGQISAATLSLINVNRFIVDSLALSHTGLNTFSIGGDFILNDSLTSTGDVSITTAEDIHLNGYVDVVGYVTLSANGASGVMGATDANVYGDQGVTILASAADINLIGSVHSSAGYVNIRAFNELDIDGAVYGQADVSLFGENGFVDLAAVASNIGTVTISGNTLTLNGAISGDAVDIHAYGAYASSAGSISFFGNITSDVGSVSLTTDDNLIQGYGSGTNILGYGGVNILMQGDEGHLSFLNNVSSSNGNVVITSEAIGISGISIDGDLQAYGNIDLTALAGNIAFGTGGADAETGYLSANSATLGFLFSDLSAGTDVALTVTGGGNGIRLNHNITAGGVITATATNSDITGFDAAYVISGAGGITLDAEGGQVNVSQTLTSASGGITLHAADFIQVADLNSTLGTSLDAEGGSARVDTIGGALFTNVTGYGDVSLANTGGGLVQINTALTSDTGSITVTNTGGGIVSSGLLSAADGVTLVATQNISISDVTAGGLLSIDAEAGDLTFTTGAYLQANLLNADAVNIFGTGFDVASVTDFYLTATGGDITLTDGDIVAGNLADLRAYDSLTLINTNITAGSLALDAGGDVSLDPLELRSDNDISINAGGYVMGDQVGLYAGTTLEIDAGSFVQFDASGLYSSGLSVDASSTIDLAGAYVSVLGYGSVADDFAVNESALTDPDLPFVPVSANPNARFRAGSVSLGELNLTGDYLFIATNNLSLTPATMLGVPVDILVQLTTFTPSANIRIVDNPAGLTLAAGDVYFSRVNHFDKFPGTTYVFGSDGYNGQIIIGENGPVAGNNADFLFFTSGGVSGAGLITTTGSVATLDLISSTALGDAAEIINEINNNIVGGTAKMAANTESAEDAGPVDESGAQVAEDAGGEDEDDETASADGEEPAEDDKYEGQTDSETNSVVDQECTS